MKEWAIVSAMFVLVICASAAILLPRVDISDKASDIPLDAAKVELTSLLTRCLGYGLDPEAKMISAFRYQFNAHGDGSQWYCIRLDPNSFKEFETHLEKLNGQKKPVLVAAFPRSLPQENIPKPFWWVKDSNNSLISYEIVYGNFLYVSLQVGSNKVYVCNLEK